MDLTFSFSSCGGSLEKGLFVALLLSFVGLLISSFVVFESGAEKGEEKPSAKYVLFFLDLAINTIFYEQVS